MANGNGGRVCPKCGTFLGQKNICPICDETEQENDYEGGNGFDPVQVDTQDVSDYVSRVIDYVAKHPNDWDDEFNTFFDGLADKPGFTECYEACSRIDEILKVKIPDSGKISGSITIKAMTDLQSIFPDLPTETARTLAVDMLKKRMESMPKPAQVQETPKAHTEPAPSRQSRAPTGFGQRPWTKEDNDWLVSQLNQLKGPEKTRESSQEEKDVDWNKVLGLINQLKGPDKK